MSRKVVRLTLDHLAALRRRRAAPACSGSSTRYAADRVDADDAAPRRRPGSPRCCASGARAVGWSLVDDVPVGYRDLRARRRSCRAPPSFPTAPVSPDAVLLTDAVRRPEHARRRAGPDAGAGHGARPGQARRDRRRRGVRRHPRPGAAAGCVLPVGLPRRGGLQDPAGARRRPRGCGWTCAPRVTWRDEVEPALERLVGCCVPARESARGPASAKLDDGPRDELSRALEIRR